MPAPAPAVVRGLAFCAMLANVAVVARMLCLALAQAFCTGEWAEAGVEREDDANGGGGAPVVRGASIVPSQVGLVSEVGS